MNKGAFIEWYALKPFALGCMITGAYCWYRFLGKPKCYYIREI
jgi:hypothetical protein